MLNDDDLMAQFEAYEKQHNLTSPARVREKEGDSSEPGSRHTAADDELRSTSRSRLFDGAPRSTPSQSHRTKNAPRAKPQMMRQLSGTNLSKTYIANAQDKALGLFKRAGDQ